jgi:hypothetical protein
MVDTTIFRVDSIDIIYTADGGAKTNAVQIIGRGVNEVPTNEAGGGKSYAKPASVKTTIALF